MQKWKKSEELRYYEVMWIEEKQEWKWNGSVEVVLRLWAVVVGVVVGVEVKLGLKVVKTTCIIVLGSNAYWNELGNVWLLSLETQIR